MAKTKKVLPTYTNDEIRQMILQFFYDKVSNATSLRGKKGSSLKMKDIKAGLKSLHSFNDSQIISNLTYLLSQGWVKEEIEKKSFTTDRGVSVPSETRYYSITAAGTDKIEGPSKFTPKRFEGIKIEATGQNIITIGDGNQVNVKYKEAAEGLLELKEGVKKATELDEETKLEIVSDIETIQGQLSKPNPNKSVIQTLWTGIERSAAVASLADIIVKVSPFITALFS
jgi:hypothetical protein